jgi:hypothetical protein
MYFVAYMNNNKLILSTFLSQMDECLNDMLQTYPTTAHDPRFVKCKLYFETLKKTNPRTMIVAWKTHVNDKYRTQIDSGDLYFFVNKDYSEEAREYYDNVVEGAINDMRETIMSMTEKNKKMCVAYIQNLCKLADLYT